MAQGIDQSTKRSGAAIRWLRGLGGFGRYLAAILHFLAIYQGITVSALVAGFFAYFTWLLGLVQKPHVYVPALVFLFVLWTYIGITVTRKQQSIQTVRTAVDYAYALITDGGWKPILGKFPPNHPTSPGAPAISLQLNVRNVCAGPVRIRVEEMRIGLDGRTNDDDRSPIELIVARLANKGFKSAGIPVDPNKDHLIGTATIRLLYGPHDGEFLRALLLRYGIQVAIDKQKEMVALVDEIIEETERPYNQS